MGPPEESGEFYAYRTFCAHATEASQMYTAAQLEPWLDLYVEAFSYLDRMQKIKHNFRPLRDVGQAVFAACRPLREVGQAAFEEWNPYQHLA